MTDDYRLHMMELRPWNVSGAPIHMLVYINEEGQVRLFDPLPGWIGELRRPVDTTAEDCRPFVMDDCGDLDFGVAAPSRQGHIHWPRWSKVSIGITVEVNLDGGEAEYTVHKIMRL